MNEYQIVSLISLTGFLILVASAFRSHDEGAEPGDLRCIIRRMQFTSLFGRAFLPQPFKRWVNRVIMGQASHVPAAEI